jgi:putative transposase
MICALVQTAVEAHAEQWEACDIVGVDPRTLQRWREDVDQGDRRTTPKKPLPNQLTPHENAAILALVNTPAYRNLTPNEIVPLLADQGRYLASASTIYRLLRRSDQLAHRTKAKPRQARHRPRELVATGPNQVWSWDITYLHTPVHGRFFYLYLLLDVWSRKIVGWAIHERESGELASELVAATCAREGVARDRLVLHADNGGPMKHATLYAVLTVLGVAPSHSRPHVSNDNPFSESIFRVLKYCTLFPADGKFASLELAREWMARFDAWYNHVHLHSGIRYVTPAQRHDGRDLALLELRAATYEAARKRHPERWSRATRNWNPIAKVILNPEPVAAATPVA